MNIFKDLEKEWITFGVILFFAVVTIGLAGIYTYKHMPRDSVSSVEQQINVVEKEQVVDTSTSTPLSTSNWQIYRNNEFGFEVKYPDSFVVNEKLGGIDYGYTTQFRFEDPLKPPSFFNGFTIETKTARAADIKFKMIGHVVDEIKRETEIKGEGYQGTKLEYDISTSGTSIPFTTAILNDGEFSYTITSSSDLVNQILSTFRFVDIDINEIKKQASLYLMNIDGFGSGVEQIGEVKQIEDVNNDGYNEFMVSASGAGGTCVGGTNYEVLYSPRDSEYFAAARSLLESLPLGTEKTFCTIINEDRYWEGCGGGYLDYVCFSNNLKEEKHAAFKEYLEEILK